MKTASAALLLAIGAMGTAMTATAADAPPPPSRDRPAVVQKTFATPEEAARALAEAMTSGSTTDLRRVLGPGASKLIRSGDPVQDNDARQAFLAGYAQSVKFETQPDAKLTLLIGNTDYPFPYPLVERDGRWRFDARQGSTEVLDRRIGRNELSAISVCLAYVDAQREFARGGSASGGGLLEYARKLLSTPGSKDGLYWETAPGEPASPLGPLVARARGQGYGKDSPETAYHGYLYRILTRQGTNAAGGAYDYLVDGRMIGGFGLVAYPARWGKSGVMSFICNHDGVVYEKNLGRKTAEVAGKMTSFDPDPTWVRSRDQ